MITATHISSGARTAGAVVFLGCFCASVAGAQQPAPAARRAPRASHFTVRSPDIKPGGRIKNEQVYSSFGCSGKNQSPALSWSAAPAGTKSYAVTMYDPDAPTGSGWWHWVLYNIPASDTALAAGAGDPASGSAPAGSTEGNTDFGTPGYGGPCPPQGSPAHRYIITVYALKTDKLDIPANTTAAFVGFNLHGATLAKATLTGRYGR